VTNHGSAAYDIKTIIGARHNDEQHAYATGPIFTVDAELKQWLYRGLFCYIASHAFR